MIAGIKPYPKYSDSGTPWLGEIPAHWERRKLRTILRTRTERNRPDLPLLSVVRERGVIVRDRDSSDENSNFIPDDLSNYKIVRVGQFAMNKMKAWQGSFGISEYDGLVSPAYFIFDLRNAGGTFFHRAIRSRAYIPFFTQASDGVRIGQWDLSQDRMREIPFYVPRPDEQSAIVRFLDHADRKIRRYIRAKQKLIKLLEEQKQAVIHRAVTRGLDPNVRLKPSGVEWLGDVPEHWEVIQLRWLMDLTTGFPFKSEGFTQKDSDVRLLRGINIEPGKIRWNAVVRWPVADSAGFDAFRLEAGDIVLGMDRPLVGSGIRAAVIGRNDLPAFLLQRVARIRPKKMLARDYLVYLLQGKCFSDYLTPIFTGISVPHMSPDQIKSYTIPLPPLEEQLSILRGLNDDLSRLDKARFQAQRQTDLLREYRTRLIADVVTGKLDVRKAAAKLPDEVPEPEPAEEIEPPAEGTDAEEPVPEEVEA